MKKSKLRGLESKPQLKQFSELFEEDKEDAPVEEDE